MWSIWICVYMGLEGIWIFLVASHVLMVGYEINDLLKGLVGNHLEGFRRVFR